MVITTGIRLAEWDVAAAKALFFDIIPYGERKKNMKIRRFLSVFLLIAVLIGLMGVVPANALEDPDIQAGAALLVDAETGHVLYAKNEHEQRAQASLTKIMVALLVLEEVDKPDGTMTLDEEITATARSLSNLTWDSSTANIKVGETMTVEDLLYCMLLKSANEVGDIFGEAKWGSWENLVARMNQRAAELGCVDTHFTNTSGLDDPQHYSSAWDIYLITREAMTHPTFMTVCSSKSHTVPATNMSDARELHTTNALLDNWNYGPDYMYDGAAGVKTGSTPEAGSCLVSTARRDDRTVISVVLGAGETWNDLMRFSETTRLFDWGFDNWDYQTVLKEDQPVSVNVELSKETNSVFLYPEKNPLLLLPRDLDTENDPDFSCVYDIPDSVDAPVKAGQKLGTVTIYYRGEEYAKVPLLAAAGVPMSRFLEARRMVEQYVSHSNVKLGLILLAVCVVLLIIWLRLVLRGKQRGGSRRYHGRTR